MMLRALNRYIENRLFEWGMVFAMLLLALEIFLWPDTMSESAFKYLSATVSPGNLGLFFLVVGVARGIALIINGRSHLYGPRVRAIGALGGAIIWAEMVWALLMLLTETNVPSPGIPIYLSLTVCEMISSYRAATDVRNRST
jgi:hypothetical protein